MADEDEWEYEYDEAETEDFYITLDLSNTAVKGASEEAGDVLHSGQYGGNPILLTTRLRAIQDSFRMRDGAVNEAPEGHELPPLGMMQITGLDTTNPLVKYNDHLLSCHWASTIGTDMFFVKPSTDSDVEPLRSLPAVDLLAIGSAKLVAKEARLIPRDDVIEKVSLDEVPSNTGVGDQSATPMDLSEDSGAPTKPPATEQPTVQPPPPNSFLARLNQAKAKRGDTTRLAVSNTSNGARLVVAEGGPSAGHVASAGAGETDSDATMEDG